MSDAFSVLIADDHVPTRDDLRRTLNADGRFRVCAEAGDAATAVQAAVLHWPDLCIMDVRMPGSGISAAWEIAARMPDARIVMLTVSSEEDDLVDALRAGACSYILKDYDPGGLAQTLAEVMAGHAAIPPRLVSHLVAQFRDTGPRRRQLVAARSPRSRLTSREWQVLELLNADLSTAQIAERLVLTPETVRSHIAAAVKKLGAQDRREALELFRAG